MSSEQPQRIPVPGFPEAEIDLFPPEPAIIGFNADGLPVTLETCRAFPRVLTTIRTFADTLEGRCLRRFLMERQS